MPPSPLAAWLEGDDPITSTLAWMGENTLTKNSIAENSPNRTCLHPNHLASRHQPPIAPHTCTPNSVADTPREDTTLSVDVVESVG